MFLPDALQRLGFAPLVDFICQDDGDGPYLKAWLTDQPQPTPEEIEGAASLPLTQGRTYKADIWRRATDAEAATIDAQINAQPIKLRNLFRDCDHLSHADPYFTALKAGFVTAFGPARADQLLALSV